MATKLQGSPKVCYVFIDDSNLWISGLIARAKPLINAEKDPRFRIDYGKLLFMVKQERQLTQAYLLGSRPPSYDSIWKAIDKNQLRITLFDRSHGKEKKVDSELSCQLMETMYELKEKKEDVVFIVITGDSDLMPPIERALKKKIHVELWSWRRSMSADFTALQKKDSNFTVNILDDVPHDKFSSINYRYKNIMRKDIDFEHALQCTNVPRGDTPVENVAEYFEKMNLLFYIFCDDFPDEDKQELIVEVPDIDPNDVLKMISTEDFKYNISKYGEQEYSAWIQVPVRQKPKRTANAKKLDEDTQSKEKVTVLAKKPRCIYQDHCSAGGKCQYTHTDFEIKLFQRPSFNYKLYKTQKCKKQHASEEDKKWCLFAHDEADSWCRKCKKYGHLTYLCKNLSASF